MPELNTTLRKMRLPYYYRLLKCKGFCYLTNMIATNLLTLLLPNAKVKRQSLHISLSSHSQKLVLLILCNIRVFSYHFQSLIGLSSLPKREGESPHVPKYFCNSNSILEQQVKFKHIRQIQIFTWYHRKKNWSQISIFNLIGYILPFKVSFFTIIQIWPGVKK